MQERGQRVPCLPLFLLPVAFLVGSHSQKEGLKSFQPQEEENRAVRLYVTRSVFSFLCSLLEAIGLEVSQIGDEGELLDQSLGSAQSFLCISGFPQVKEGGKGVGRADLQCVQIAHFLKNLLVFNALYKQMCLFFLREMKRKNFVFSHQEN